MHNDLNESYKLEAEDEEYGVEMRPRTHRFRDIFELNGDKFIEDSFLFFESVRTCSFNGDEPGFHYYNGLGIITDNA